MRRLVRSDTQFFPKYVSWDPSTRSASSQKRSNKWEKCIVLPFLQEKSQCMLAHQKLWEILGKKKLSVYSSMHFLVSTGHRTPFSYGRPALEQNLLTVSLDHSLFSYLWSYTIGWLFHLDAPRAASSSGLLRKWRLCLSTKQVTQTSPHVIYFLCQITSKDPKQFTIS